MDTIKSPYPWFGGKARVAPEVWNRFGDVKNYVEPFFGGGAVMLARPHWPFDGELRTETVNDINAWLCNFWRAVKFDPDAVGEYASDPVSELDLHARGDALFYKGLALDGNHRLVPDDFCERLRSDPKWYCAEAAGWWVWGQSSWIGNNWGRRECRSLPHPSRPKGVNRQRPHLGDAGQGVNRQLPHLGNPGKGVNRKLPHLGDPGMGVADTNRRAAITAYMRQLCERVASVRICCGDWTRVLGPSCTVRLGTTGVFLDPPYAVDDRDTCYGEHDSRTLAHDVREWAIEHGDDARMRIALCGYDGEHAMPDSWDCWAWKTGGGYASQNSRRNDNGTRERIWFSPHCLRCAENFLFSGGA